jgi:hypothetical protein
MLFGFAPRHPFRDAKWHHDIFLDGLPGKQLVELLENHHAIGRWTRDRRATKENSAFDGGHVAADRLEQGRFTAT